MSKRIFKYEGNGSESESQALDQFLKEAKNAENPFDYVVEASESSAAGIVGRVNSGDPDDLLPGDQELFNSWEDQYSGCDDGCPCPGMSDATCAMFAARADNPDTCDAGLDCQGVCGGTATTDFNGACCQPADMEGTCDGNCFGPTTAAEHCPNNLVSVHYYDDRVECVANDSSTCDCSGTYDSVGTCISIESLAETSDGGAGRPVSEG